MLASFVAAMLRVVGIEAFSCYCLVTIGETRGSARSSDPVRREGITVSSDFLDALEPAG